MTLIEAAKESDSLYFELGATSTPLPGCQLATMPGLEHLDSASVFHRVQSTPDPRHALERMRAEVHTRGLPLIRLYLMNPDPIWEAALQQDGFTSREELILGASHATRSSWEQSSSLHLTPIQTPDQWEIRKNILGSGETVPDGHGSDLNAYLDMEQQKAQNGGLTFYLAATSGGMIVGSAGLLHVHSAARLKNLVVHAQHRGRGYAAAMIRAFASLADPSQSLIAYALQYPPALRLYQSLNFTRLGSCFEWTPRKV
ncbi:MAG TPA: GNAT family N-acetyltransferase [Kiritimatiellia bacterium]|nr:GNAT family N-acetyltransferase [Kiritimatiellia bacterium]